MPAFYSKRNKPTGVISPVDTNNVYATVMERMMDSQARVQFRLELRSFAAKPEVMRPDAAAGQIGRIFNMRAEDIRLMEARGGAVINCSPLQFVGFLVWRHGVRFANSYAELQVQLVKPEVPATDLPAITARKES